MLTLEGVHSYYGESHVIQGVDLHVERGETVALVGRNGAGKTTLLKTVMGIVRARAGRIRFDGVDVTALDTHVIARRGITLVPEERRIFPRLTVDENLRVATLASGAGDATRARVFEYFPRLRERLGHAGQDLSGGEQQMLALARGFLARPQLMLIDELSGGLMPLLVDALMDILQRINAEGITILLVEQDLEVALALARRCYVLDQGRIEYSGTAQSLRDNRDVQQRYLGVA
ncbi:MAG TPA: ABC transporter ATP-binding protein [Candidatus Acidoferrum sp.]|nr:ABC transporter ATP-binding protein [Candidatus Acidoferrum sp.]